MGAVNQIDSLAACAMAVAGAVATHTYPEPRGNHRGRIPLLLAGPRPASCGVVMIGLLQLGKRRWPSARQSGGTKRRLWIRGRQTTLCPRAKAARRGGIVSTCQGGTGAQECKRPQKRTTDESRHTCYVEPPAYPPMSYGSVVLLVPATSTGGSSQIRALGAPSRWSSGSLRPEAAAARSCMNLSTSSTFVGMRA